MKTTTLTIRALVPALATGLLALGALPAAAAPDEPQRLRGMADRTFAVTVDVYVGDPAEGFLVDQFDNCYTFAASGAWIDAAAPGALGTWEQHGTGAATTYTAELGGFVQQGTVTPARGMGVLQLDAVTEIPEGVFGPYALTALTTGAEVDSCN